MIIYEIIHRVCCFIICHFTAEENFSLWKNWPAKFAKPIDQRFANDCRANFLFLSPARNYSNFKKHSIQNLDSASFIHARNTNTNARIVLLIIYDTRRKGIYIVRIYLNLKFVLQLSFRREQTKKISKRLNICRNYRETMIKYKILEQRAKCQDCQGDKKKKCPKIVTFFKKLPLMRIFCLNWCSAGILCNVLLPFLEFIAIVLSFFLLLSYLIELPNSSSLLSNVWLSSTRENVARLTKNPKMYVSETKNLLKSIGFYKVLLIL